MMSEERMWEVFHRHHGTLQRLAVELAEAKGSKYLCIMVERLWIQDLLSEEGMMELKKALQTYAELAVGHRLSNLAWMTDVAEAANLFTSTTLRGEFIVCIMNEFPPSGLIPRLIELKPRIMTQLVGTDTFTQGDGQ